MAQLSRVGDANQEGGTIIRGASTVFGCIEICITLPLLKIV